MEKKLREKEEEKTPTEPSPFSEKEHQELLEKLQDKTSEIERLEQEVEQWILASEQLQRLGEEAVEEISKESEELRREVKEKEEGLREERRLRKDAEAELLKSEEKFHDLDRMFARLMPFSTA